ncbi:MAG: transcriptional repressor NrdR [Candidatus Eiseniibacteriota bacterium]|nr:MAG: transcriptional repressor NrdR [Candidatus Eisenbacteria bacterium]
MKCPVCGHTEDKVVDSRSTKDDTAVRRRRECLGCGRRFTTYEYIENTPLMVIKKDGRREPFRRGKLKAGILRACEKRPISSETVDEMVDRIESGFQRQIRSEVTSKDIGESVMKALFDLDDVAYVRFASVYRQFKDVSQFMEELKGLLSKSQQWGSESVSSQHPRPKPDK